MSTQRPHGPVTFDELTAGLIWPKLLRAFPMSLQPKRMLIGVLGAIGLWGGNRALAPWLDSSFDSLMTNRQYMADVVHFGGKLSWLPPFYLDDVIAGAVSHWYAFIPMATILVVFFTFLMGAISRSAAVDIAADLSLGFRESLIFAASRWKAMVFVVVIPMLIMYALCGLIALSALWLTNLTGMKWLDTVFVAPAVLASLIATALLVGFVLGHSMLAPAIASECTDSADALQRVYAYILGRPGRLLLYLAVLTVAGAIAWWCLNFFVVFALESAQLIGIKESSTVPESYWLVLLKFLLRGWLISYYSCAGTLLYLLMRRVNDQQDIREIWLPGMIPGTQAPIIPPKPGTPVDLDDE